MCGSLGGGPWNIVGGFLDGETYGALGGFRDGELCDELVIICGGESYSTVGGLFGLLATELYNALDDPRKSVGFNIYDVLGDLYGLLNDKL
jgi:hypothetical protein